MENSNPVVDMGLHPRLRKHNHLLNLQIMRFYSTARKVLKEALENGPKFSDFVSGTENLHLPGNGRLPKWLKTPIPVGERYFHLKETLRDLKLHTVKKAYALSLIWFLRYARKQNAQILGIVGMGEIVEKQRRPSW